LNFLNGTSFFIAYVIFFIAYGVLDKRLNSVRAVIIFVNAN